MYDLNSSQNNLFLQTFNKHIYHDNNHLNKYKYENILEQFCSIEIIILKSHYTFQEKIVCTTSLYYNNHISHDNNYPH